MLNHKKYETDIRTSGYRSCRKSLWNGLRGKTHEMYILREAFEAGAEWQAKQSPWTLVKDKLPDESELVLCRMVSNEAIVSGFIFISPDGLPCVATLPSFEFEDYGGYVCDMWMPIPKFN